MTTTTYIITTTPYDVLGAGAEESVSTLHGDEKGARAAFEEWIEDAESGVGCILRLREAGIIDPDLRARAESLTSRHMSDPEVATVAFLFHGQSLGREIARVDWRI